MTWKNSGEEQIRRRFLSKDPLKKKKKKERKERKKKALSLRFVCPLAYNRSAKRYSRDVVKKREEKKKVTLGRP